MGASVPSEVISICPSGWRSQHTGEGARHQAPWRVRVAVGEAVVTDGVQPALGAQQHAVLRQLQRAAGGDLSSISTG